jgi:CheY-like chemotaxis protein
LDRRLSDRTPSVPPPWFTGRYRHRNNLPGVFFRNDTFLCFIGAVQNSCMAVTPLPNDTTQAVKQAVRLAATKVLVVDDEYYMRKVVRTLLTIIGVGTVYEALDGADGLEQIRRNAPDLVIVDWQMPKLDGPSFVRIVRSPATCAHPQVPIIMLTGHSERARVVAAIEIGVNDFLLKPVSRKALEERLLAVLDDPRATLQPGQAGGQEARKRAAAIHADSDKATTTLVMLD